MRIRSHRITVVATLAVPLLLVGVALVHRYLVETYSLVPWTGGGFAMFSTVDKDLGPSRVVRASADVHRSRIYLEVTDFMDLSARHEALVRRTAIMPTDAALSELAEALRRQEWSDKGQLIADPHAPVRRAGVADLRLEVWRVFYDLDRRVVSPVLVRELSLPG